MIIFLNTRMYPLQRRYMETAHRDEKEKKIWLDWERFFFHCDSQNIPSSIFDTIIWLFGLIKLEIILLAIKYQKSIINSLLNKEEILVLEDYTISIQAMVSHLAKRHRSANRVELAKNKFDILILTCDQLVLNKKFQYIKESFDEKTDTVVVFNGRVSPESLISKLWRGRIKYVEQGFHQEFYYDALPPVSKRRWDNEFYNLKFDAPIAQNFPRPKNVILFLTSPYEFMFADNDFQPQAGCFQSQYEVLLAYVEICQDLNIKPMVKFHPRNPKEMFLLDHGISKFPFDFVETAEDASYLIKTSDLVVLSSSSLAIDAAVLEVPNCHCLSSFYEGSGISFATKEKEALRTFMKHPLLVKDAKNRGVLLQKGFEASASLYESGPSISRYLKRAVLGH